MAAIDIPDSTDQAPKEEFVRGTYGWAGLRGLALGALMGMAAACSDDDGTGPGNGDPTIEISLSSSSLSLLQGSTGTVTVNLARGGGFTGPVALTVQGAPSGVTVAGATIGSGATSAALEISADPSAAPGTANLTVRATGDGVAEKTASLALTVEETPPAGGFSWRFCDGVPEWVVYQDGDGPWTRAALTGNEATVGIGGARGAVAFVSPDGAGGADTEVHYGTRPELEGLGAQCPATPGKTVSGTMAGLSDSDLASVSLGTASALVFPFLGTDFTLEDVPAGPRDLLASQIPSDDAGAGAPRFILRRGIDPAPGSVLPVLDFDAAEAFDAVERNLTVENLGADESYVVGAYLTATETLALYFLDELGAVGGARTWFGLPEDRQANGDLHVLTVLAAAPGEDDPTDIRGVVAAFRQPLDRTVTLGPALSAPTVTTVASVPYARIRAQYTVQAEYDRYWTIEYFQGEGGGEARSVTLAATAGYANGAAVDLTIPDFSDVDGWINAWGLQGGAPTQWVLTASGWNPPGGISEVPFQEGSRATTATRGGQITP